MDGWMLRKIRGVSSDEIRYHVAYYLNNNAGLSIGYQTLSLLTEQPLSFRHTFLS
jgi:hypothetical protein